MKVDAVVDLVYGDCGKGKVSKWLLENNKLYTYVCSASGGPNKGHTLYHNGKKFITHHVPSGVFHNIKSIIGSGCVVYPKTFLKEIEELEKNGINAAKYTKISSYSHIITDKHIEEDIATDKIGSTKRGIMPVYRDKYARCGIRAQDCPELIEFICDQYEELMDDDNYILIEGAQGMWLCPDHSPHYPFITISPPTVSYAFHSLGLPIQSINKIYGCCKSFDTYVGNRKDFESHDEIFNKIVEIAKEYGSTTQRRRKCNWINVSMLEKAIKINGVTDLIINKMDVLQQVDKWCMIIDNQVVDVKTKQNFKDYFLNKYPQLNITFSYSPETV